MAGREDSSDTGWPKVTLTPLGPRASQSCPRFPRTSVSRAQPLPSEPSFHSESGQVAEPPPSASPPTPAPTTAPQPPWCPRVVRRGWPGAALPAPAGHTIGAPASPGVRAGGGPVAMSLPRWAIGYRAMQGPESRCAGSCPEPCQAMRGYEKGPGPSWEPRTGSSLWSLSALHSVNNMVSRRAAIALVASLAQAVFAATPLYGQCKSASTGLWARERRGKHSGLTRGRRWKRVDRRQDLRRGSLLPIFQRLVSRFTGDSPLPGSLCSRGLFLQVLAVLAMYRQPATRAHNNGGEPAGGHDDESTVCFAVWDIHQPGPVGGPGRPGVSDLRASMAGLANAAQRLPR